MYISLAGSCGFTLLLVHCMTTRIKILSGRGNEDTLSKCGFHYVRDMTYSWAVVYYRSSFGLVMESMFLRTIFKYLLGIIPIKRLIKTNQLVM